MLTGISDLCSLWPDGGGCAVKMGGPTAHVLGGEAVLNLGMLRSKQRYSHKRHLRNQQNPSWNVTTKQRERPNPLNFKKHPKHLILVGMSKFSNNTEFERFFFFFRWIHWVGKLGVDPPGVFLQGIDARCAKAVFEVGEFKKNQPRIYIYNMYIDILIHIRACTDDTWHIYIYIYDRCMDRCMHTCLN